MTPAIVDVFTAAAHHTVAVTTNRDITLAAELHRLRGDNARLREALAAYDARVDLLQRASEARESPKFKTREGMVA